MVHIANDGGGGGDQIVVDTEALHAAAPTFRRVGQQVDTLGQKLASSVQSAGGDMFVVLEFAKMASILEHLQERMNMAMQCAAGGLTRIGLSLEVASELYGGNENAIISEFKQLEDDTKQWNTPPIVFPGINPGGITVQPVPTPVPLPQPGITDHKGPAVNPGPVPVLPLLPNIIP